MQKTEGKDGFRKPFSIKCIGLFIAEGYDMAKSTVMARLAWRAKWRRRLQTWKKHIILVFLISIILTLYVISRVDIAYNYILKNNITGVEDDRKVKEAALEQMYNLGRFCEITMREQFAQKCYMTVIDWGFDDDVVPIARIPDNYYDVGEYSENEWVGYAFFRQAEIYKRRYKQRAHKMFQFYLEHFAANEEIATDPDFNERARVSVELYRRG